MEESGLVPSASVKEALKLERAAAKHAKDMAAAGRNTSREKSIPGTQRERRAEILAEQRPKAQGGPPRRSGTPPANRVTFAENVATEGVPAVPTPLPALEWDQVKNLDTRARSNSPQHRSRSPKGKGKGRGGAKGQAKPVAKAKGNGKNNGWRTILLRPVKTVGPAESQDEYET